MDINNIKHEIEKLFKENSYNCRSISIARKEKDGKETSEICIRVSVPEKKSLDQLSPSEIVPEEIEIDGTKFKTDVKEINEIKFMACFSNSNDPDILKLQGNPSLITPLKGGQEIIKFPLGWETNTSGDPSGFSVGTLGFFAVDDIDDKVVGITNAHVVVDKLLFTSNRDIREESDNPYNTKKEFNWPVDGQSYSSSARARSGTGFADSIIDVSSDIKRYHPMHNDGQMNYVDTALLIMNPQNITENDSFKIHHPSGVTESTAFLPFATTTEIDSLLDTPKPKMFSVGRTTGPKGWGTDPACTIEAVGLGVNINVGFDNGNLSIPFGDIIHYQHSDGSAGIIDGGDSGSALIAEFGGVKKIVGLAFAGSGDTINAFACRIDRIAQALKIRQWDNTFTYDDTVPTSNIISFPIEDPSSDQLSIIQNGKEYFQIGSDINVTSPQSGMLSISSINPTTGDEAGGTDVTITGENFDTGTAATVTFGGIDATNIVVVSDTEITCTTPAGTGTVDVVLTQGGESETLAGAFEFTAASSVWTPASIPAANLPIWLDRDDASTVTDAGGGEFNWLDKSGNNHDFVSNGAPTTVNINGRAFWQFDNNQEFLGPDINPEDGTNDEYEAFIVMRADAVGAAAEYEGIIAFGEHSSGFWLARYIRDTRQLLQAFNNSTRADSSVFNSFPNSGKPLFVSQLRKIVGTSVRIYDAATEISNVTTSGAVAEMTTGGQVRLGRLTGLSTGDYLNGAMGEVLILKNAPAEREKVEGYLHHRHGLESQLPADHPYKNSPPSISESVTPTPTPTPTPSVSDSTTPTPTPTPSVSESATPTPTPSISESVTPTPTPSPTQTSMQSSDSLVDVMLADSPIQLWNFDQAGSTVTESVSGVSTLDRGSNVGTAGALDGFAIDSVDLTNNNAGLADTYSTTSATNADQPKKGDDATFAFLARRDTGGNLSNHWGIRTVSNNQGTEVSLESDGSILVKVFNGSWEQYSSSTGLTADATTHLVHVTFTDSTDAVEVFVDGVSVATGTLSGGLGRLSSRGEIAIGAVRDSSITKESDASVQLVAFYRKVLSAAQIQAQSEARMLSISSINPTTGDEAGGTSVTITGENFDTGNSATVTFGGVSATNITVVSKTEITCTTPAGTGTVDVAVTQGSESDTLAAAFVYEDLWTPADITTSLWLDASENDTITTDVNGDAQQLDDISGNGRHMTFNTNPAIATDSKSQHLVFAGGTQRGDLPTLGISGSDNRTLMMVVDPGSSSDRGLFSMNYSELSDEGTRWTFRQDNGGIRLEIQGGGTTTSLNDSGGGIYGAILDGTTMGDHTIWRDGVSENTSGTTTVNTVDTMNAVAADGSSSVNMSGKFRALVMTASALSTDDRQKLEGYLAHKFGIESNLPADHPYKSGPPLKTVTHDEVILSRNPLGYWKVDETSGVAAADSSGNGNDGTFRGTPTLGATPLASGSTAAMRVPGNQAHIEVPIWDGNGDFTCEFWIQTTNEANEMLMWDSDNFNARIFISINGDATGNLTPGHIRVFTRTGGDPSNFDSGGDTGITDGEPHNVVVTRSGSTGTIYVDGVAVNSGPVESGDVHGTIFHIGSIFSGDSGFELDGILDKIVFYDRALTSTEVSENYNTGLI